MTAYVSNTTWPEIGERLLAAERIALCTHTNPDGDALGSTLGLARALHHLGKTADVFLMGRLDAALQPMATQSPHQWVEQDPPGDDYDVIVVLDTGAWSQLEPLEPWLRRHAERVIVIDHHARGDEVGTRRLVDPGASAAAEMVLALLDVLDCPPEATAPGPGSVAEALFIGVATDTGWFRYSNAGPRTFDVAARLMRCGVDKSRLFREIEETHRPERLALETRALSSLEYARDGAVAIQSLRLADFAETGCTVEELTGVVNLPMIVGSVRVAVLLAEIEPGLTKMSFRAKPPADGAAALGDVNELARHFGGGGHVFAAGARLRQPLAETRQALLDVLDGKT